MLRFVGCGPRPGPRTRGSIARARHTKRLGAFIAGVVVLLVVAPGAQADTCRSRNYVDSLFLAQTGTVRITSRLGQRYDFIDSAAFDANIIVDLCGDVGALTGVIVHLGECTGRGQCSAMPIMHQEYPKARDFRTSRPFSFDFPRGDSVRERIFQACDAVFDAQRNAAADRTVEAVSFFVTLGVETRRDPGSLGEAFGVVEGVVHPFNRVPLKEYSKTRVFQASIVPVCAAIPPMATAPPKITEAALGVATSGKTCPMPATADVIIAAEAPRDVYYKIERGNGTTTTADWIHGKIKMQKGPTGGKSAFLRAAHDLRALDPGTRKFRLWIDGWRKTPWRTVEVDCPPFKVFSAWLKYDVEDKDTCPKRVTESATFKATRPGKAPFEIKTADGLVVHSGTAIFEREGMGYIATVERPNLTMNAVDSDMMALIKTQSDANSGWTRLKVGCLEALSGKLTLNSFAANSCQAEALVAIHTNRAGELPYELECGPGRSWQRTVSAPANKIGVDKVRFAVADNERVTCILRTRIADKVQFLDGISKTFRCR